METDPSEVGRDLWNGLDTNGPDTNGLDTNGLDERDGRHQGGRDNLYLSVQTSRPFLTREKRLRYGT